MLKRFSFGTGDRFGCQGEAQLSAVQKARDEGVEISPVWNKSFREHEIIGTEPSDVRTEADEAVKALNWSDDYFVDADHITLDTVDEFLDSSNFFTIDVADFIGKKADDEELEEFVNINESLLGDLKLPGIDEEFEVTEDLLQDIAEQYVSAINEAGRIYRHINEEKDDEVVIEVSMDEVDEPQTPIELFFILKSLAEEGVPLNTVAPKFTGRFNKGVDYVGDLKQFRKEFEQDVLVIAHVIDEYGLPDNLKLSVHSGSDKFSLYKPMREIVRKHDAGLHLKTSGTTWLEELAGLAESGSDGLDMVKSIYERAYNRFKELTKPYAPVIDVNSRELPDPVMLNTWTSDTVVSRIVHDPDNSSFDPQLRQFLHCSYKVAAEFGDDYINLLKKHKEPVGKRVTDNLFEKHIKPLFLE